MQQLNYPFAITGVGMTQISSAQQPIVPGYPNGTNGKFQNVVVQGNYAYVAASGGNGTGIIGLSLVIYNVANPQAPYVEGYLETGTVPWSSGPSYLNGAYAIAVSGQYAYIFSSGASTLYIVNISNPAAPTNVSALLISGSPGSLYSGAYSNGYVYIATQNKGLTVVNVSNPATPVQVFQEGGTTNKSVGVCVANGYCYTTNYQTTSPWTVRYLKIWSLATPSTPSLLETYTLPAGTKPAAVAVYGNTAFVSDLNTSSVQIVDVTTPTSPNYLASMQASSAFDVMNTAAVSVTRAESGSVHLISRSNRRAASSGDA